MPVHGERGLYPPYPKEQPVFQFRSKQYERDYELISDFETFGDWILTAGDSIAVDAVNFKEGNQSIRWRSTNAVPTTAERTINLNALGHHFEFWVRVEFMYLLDNYGIDVEVAAPWARWFHCELTWNNMTDSGLWAKVGLSKADFVAMGGAVNADWATVTKIRMFAQSNPGVTANLVFDDLRMVRDRFAGKVTLRFDDSYETAYTEARPRMDEYGFRGVSATRIDRVDGAGYLTLAQLEHLQEQGWDIVSHSMTHARFTEITYTEIEAELWNSQRWLIENGFYKGSRFFVPPYHTITPVSLDQIDKYYLASQHRHPLFDTIPPESQYLNVKLEVDAATPLATIQGLVDRTVEDQAWLTLFFHDLSGMLVLFQDIIDYVEASGLEVVTFSDVFDELIGIRADYTQLLEFGVQDVITPNATSYPCPGGGLAAQTATEIRIPISRDGWLKNLRVRQRVASGGAGLTDIYTVRINGVNTGLTCTLDNVTVGSDLVNNARVDEGDEVSVSLVSNNVADVSADVSVTVELELLM